MITRFIALMLATALTAFAAPPTSPAGKPAVEAKPLPRLAASQPRQAAKDRDAATIASLKETSGLTSNQAAAFLAAHSDATREALYRDAVNRSIAKYLATAKVIGTKVRYRPPALFEVAPTNGTFTIIGVSNVFVVIQSPDAILTIRAESLKGLW